MKSIHFLSVLSIYCDINRNLLQSLMILIMADIVILLRVILIYYLKVNNICLAYLSIILNLNVFVKYI